MIRSVMACGLMAEELNEYGVFYFDSLDSGKVMYVPPLSTLLELFLTCATFCLAPRSYPTLITPSIFTTLRRDELLGCRRMQTSRSSEVCVG